MILPQYHFISFKKLLNYIFSNFFNDYNSKFEKQNDKYILLENISLQQYEQYIEKYIYVFLSKNVKPYDIINSPIIYFIVNDCLPFNNIIKSYCDKKTINYVNKLTSNDNSVKFLLCESDILLDITKINQACVNVFNRLFKSDITKFKIFTNVFFIQHKYLDENTIIRILYYIFGKINCKNVDMDQLCNTKQIFISINDIMHENAKNLNKLNSNSFFKNIIYEIKNYVTSKCNIIHL